MSKLFVLTERPSIYLASKSPRRQELLRQLGVDFTELLLREAAGRRRDVVEAPRKDESPIEYIKRVARTKASVGWHQLVRRGLAPKPVLAADTEVVLDGAVLGKPKDAMGAIDMLRRLSGKTHEVSTAVAVLAMLPDVGDVQERGAFEADLDERRLHARQHACDLAQVNIADQAARARALHVQLLDHALLEHRHPRFLRRHVDEDLVAHGESDSGVSGTSRGAA